MSELSDRKRWAKASSRRSSMNFLHEQGFRMGNGYDNDNKNIR